MGGRNISLRPLRTDGSVAHFSSFNIGKHFFYRRMFTKSLVESQFRRELGRNRLTADNDLRNFTHARSIQQIVESRKELGDAVPERPADEDKIVFPLCCFLHDRFHRQIWRKEFRFMSVLRLSLIHISEPTRLGMISYAVFCLKKKK